MSKEYQRPNNILLKSNNESPYKEYEGNFFKRVKPYNNEENLIAISFKEDLDYKKITKEKILKDYELIYLVLNRYPMNNGKKVIKFGPNVILFLVKKNIFIIIMKKRKKKFWKFIIKIYY